MSVCASPNVVSIPIVQRYVLTNAVNHFGKRERDRVRTIWFVHSCAVEVASYLRHRFAHDHSGAVPTRRGIRWFAMDFTKLMDERRLILLFVLETLDRRMANIRSSLVDLFRSSQVAKYAINFDKHLLSLDSTCQYR
jgi:hypothetical protein